MRRQLLQSMLGAFAPCLSMQHRASGQAETRAEDAWISRTFTIAELRKIDLRATAGSLYKAAKTKAGVNHDARGVAPLRPPQQE